MKPAAPVTRTFKAGAFYRSRRDSVPGRASARRASGCGGGGDAAARVRDADPVAHRPVDRRGIEPHRVRADQSRDVAARALVPLERQEIARGRDGELRGGARPHDGIVGTAHHGRLPQDANRDDAAAVAAARCVVDARDRVRGRLRRRHRARDRARRDAALDQAVGPRQRERRRAGEGDVERRRAAGPETVAKSVAVAAVTGTEVLAFVDKPLCETVAKSCTVPLAGAEKTMLGVPWPETSEPFCTAQKYLAPAPASGTEAVPFACGQTLPPVVFAAEGGAGMRDT